MLEIYESVYTIIPRVPEKVHIFISLQLGSVLIDRSMWNNYPKITNNQLLRSTVWQQYTSEVGKSITVVLHIISVWRMPNIIKIG